MKQDKGSKTVLSKKALMIVIPLIAVLAVLVTVMLTAGKTREVILKDYGIAFSSTGRIMNIMRVPGSEADIRDLVSILVPDGKLEVREDALNYEEESLSFEIPAFFNNNSYMYIPQKEAVFLDDTLRIRSFGGKAFLIKEELYDESYIRRESAKNMLMFSCTKNLYVALKDFDVITNGEKFTISPMELVLFDGYNIRTAVFDEKVAKRQSHGINRDSLVVINGKTFEITDFLSVLGLTVERDSTSGGLDKIAVPDDGTSKEVPKPIDDRIVKISEETYQYCLGYRYDYPKNMEAYNKGGVWFQKREDFTSEFELTPIYGKEKIYFPADYAVVIPKERKQFKLPAFSALMIPEDFGENYGEKKPVEEEFFEEIEEDETDESQEELPEVSPQKESVIVKALSVDGKEEKEMPASILYRAENFLFTDSVTVSWNDRSFSLAPFSFVSFDGSEILEFYDAGEDKFYSYVVDVESIKVMFDDKTGVDVISREIIVDGKSEILVLDDPSGLGSYFDESPAE